MLRGAFIGFGNVAAKGHLPGWQSVNDDEIVAATDAIAAQGKVFLEACPGGQWHKTVDELLSDKTLDFVDICTPPSTHAALIKRAWAPTVVSPISPSSSALVTSAATESTTMSSSALERTSVSQMRRASSPEQGCETSKSSRLTPNLFA